MPTLRYHTDAHPKRDLRLDLIRGYAIFAMSVNHFGLDRSVFHTITGGSVFLINAAEVFFFISGLTLGVISARKPIAEAAGRCYRRAGQILLYMLLLALAGAYLFREEEGATPLLWLVGRVLTLQEAPFWGDVLAAYVAYLLITPIALFMLHAGRWRSLLAGICGVYLLSQIDPASLGLPFASFRNLAANTPIFLGAIVLGWHRDAVHAWWARSSLRIPIDTATVLLGVFFAVAYANNYFAVAAWAEFMDRFHNLGAREYHMPPTALLLVAVYLRVLWLLVDRGWRILRVALSWLVMPLGRDALFAYVMHAVMMPVTWLVLEQAPFALDADTALGATLITALYLALVWSATAVRLRLGNAIGAVEGPIAAVPRRALPATTALALLGVALLHPGNLTGEPQWGDDEDEEGFAQIDRIREIMLDELGEFDTPAGAVVITGLEAEHENDDARANVEDLAHQLAEIVWDELGEPEGPLRVAPLLEAEDFGVEPALLADRLAEHGIGATPGSDDPWPPSADVLVFIVRVDPEEPWEAADRIREPLTEARRAKPDSLVVIAALAHDE